MNNAQSLGRSIVRSRQLLRPFFFVLFLVVLTRCYAGEPTRYAITAGTSYTDIYRERSAQSQLTLLQKSQHLSFTSASLTDTFGISYTRSEDAGSYRQQLSHLGISMNHTASALFLLYHGRTPWGDLSIDAGIGPNSTSMMPIGCLAFSRQIIPSRLTGTIAVERSIGQSGMTVLFQDMTVPLSFAPPVWNGTIGFEAALTDNIHTAGAIYTSFGSDPGKNNSFGVDVRHSATGGRASVRWKNDGDGFVTLEADAASALPEATMKDDAVDFGSVRSGGYRNMSIGSTAGGSVGMVPLEADVRFSQYRCYGVGDIQSWPFTTLAASIIANRMYFRADAVVKHHRIGLRSRFGGETFQFQPSIAYHHLSVDGTLEHWEPELLVFGRKDFRSVGFPVRYAHLLALGGTVRFPVMGAVAAVEAHQLVPLSVTERGRTAAPGSGGGDPGPVSPSVVRRDGGRWFALTAEVPF